MELGLDQPLCSATALEADKLGRKAFAQAAVTALRQISSNAGFVLSVEGAWGSGKTSALAMIEALLRAKDSPPVIVHFNPWLIGDRDALLRHFLSKIAAEVKLADHAANGKKVARELKAYGKVFDFIKLVPGAEPWASLVKSVIESAGESVDAVATYKTPDIETSKNKVERALQHFERPIVVFIDDIDRLFPLEVFEMVRIIKAVGALPNIGYVLAWDSEYVGEALKTATVPHADAYLDKVVQVRFPLPAIGLEARSTLINQALSRLPPEAHTPYFENSESRLNLLYFSGLREVLEQPRDFARVFNTVALIEPALRGEVVLADIVGLATLMVKAPQVYELMRTEPRWFIGRLHGDHALVKKSEELVKEGRKQLEKAISQSSRPHAVQKLVYQLFPLTARADEEFVIGRVIDVEGHLAAPARFLIALQLHIGSADVSLVLARRFLLHAEQRPQIVQTLTPKNCMEFMECLGDMAGSIEIGNIDQIQPLCRDIARLADTEPFASTSRMREGFFRLSAEDVAITAIRRIVEVHALENATTLGEYIVTDPQAITVATELFVKSYLVGKKEDEILCCSARAEKQLSAALAKNILKSAEAGTLLDTCNPGVVLWRLSQFAKSECAKLFSVFSKNNSQLDMFVLAILSDSYDSVKGQRYCLPKDLSVIENYCPLIELKELATVRLEDKSLANPIRAAWRAIIEEKSIYGVDGSYVKY